MKQCNKICNFPSTVCLSNLSQLTCAFERIQEVNCVFDSSVALTTFQNMQILLKNEILDSVLTCSGQ